MGHFDKHFRVTWRDLADDGATPKSVDILAADKEQAIVVALRGAARLRNMVEIISAALVFELPANLRKVIDENEHWVWTWAEAQDMPDDRTDLAIQPNPTITPFDQVNAYMAAATEIEDVAPPIQSDDNGDRPAPPHDDSGQAGELPGGRLSSEQWQTLVDCAALQENDRDNGKRLLKWYGERLLHIGEFGWCEWLGTHWEHEQGEHAVIRCAQDVADLVMREAGMIEPSKKEKAICESADLLADVERSALSLADKAILQQAVVIKKGLATKRQSRYKFGIRSGDKSRTRAMIDQAEPHKSVTPHVLDPDAYALNVKNGTLRFSMVEDEESDHAEPRMKSAVRLDKHDPADLITKLADCEYDPAATCPIWLGDLERFQPERSMRQFLQVFMGYTALGITGEQVYAFMYGDGANWKSAFLQSIARTIGMYCKPQNYNSVSGQNMPTGDKPSPDWARLPGVRMLTIEEVPRREPIREELVKLLTSGSPLPVRHLNKGMFDLTPQFTCIMTSNAEPNIGGHDKGIWRRTLIIPWDVTIGDNEKLPFERVMALYEPERPGILNWLVHGVQLYMTHGLAPFITHRMKEFTASVRSERDSAGSFVEDMVIADVGNSITSKALYEAYVEYCERNGLFALNVTAFGKQVKRCEVGGSTMEMRKKKSHGIRKFVDVSVRKLDPLSPADGSNPDDIPF